MIWKNRTLCLFLFFQTVCGTFPYVIKRAQDREEYNTEGCERKSRRPFTLKKVGVLRVYSAFVFVLMAIAYYTSLQHLSRENYSWLQSETRIIITTINDAVDITAAFLVYARLLQNHSILVKTILTLEDITEVPLFAKKWYPRMAFFSIFQVTLNFMTSEQRWSTDFCEDCVWFTHFRDKLGVAIRRYVSPVLFAQTVMLFHALVLVMEKAYIEIKDEVRHYYSIAEEVRTPPSTLKDASEFNNSMSQADDRTVIYNVSKDFTMFSTPESPEFTKEEPEHPPRDPSTLIQKTKERLLRIYDFHQLLNSFFLPPLTLILLQCVVGSIVSVFSLSYGFMQKCEVLAAFGVMAGHAHVFIYFICIIPEVINRKARTGFLHTGLIFTTS